MCIKEIKYKVQWYFSVKDRIIVKRADHTLYIHAWQSHSKKLLS